jgi:hypothetical protein
MRRPRIGSPLVAINRRHEVARYPGAPAALRLVADQARHSGAAASARVIARRGARRDRRGLVPCLCKRGTVCAVVAATELQPDEVPLSREGPRDSCNVYARSASDRRSSRR